MAVNLGIIGATGVVGRQLVKELEEFALPLGTLSLYSTEKSAGEEIGFMGDNLRVQTMSEDAFLMNDVFIASAGAKAALTWGEAARKHQKLLIDNSSAWRMEADVPLVVPEINPQMIKEHNYIIANPNCSTIQLVLTLQPLNQKYGLKRVIVSTYQSVSGSGKKALEQLENEISAKAIADPAYPHPIAYNCIPHIDLFLDNGYTKEEQKMIDESSKILADIIPLTATCVRVPVRVGHAESVNVELNSDFDLRDIYDLWNGMPGMEIIDDPDKNQYPLQLDCENKKDVFVGRLRHDNTNPRAINYWVVSDNLRKGAATNAVQILKYWMEEIN